MTKLLKNFLSKSRISNNTAPKLASLLFAVLLWVYVMDIEDPETVRTFKDVPVKLMHVEELQDSGLVLIDNQEHTIDVKIEGRRSDVLSAKKGEIELSADLIGFSKGTNSVPVESNISADNVKITSLSKPDIKVDLDRVVKIPKSVEIMITGELPSGYEPGALVANPQEILVEGPESVVNTVARLVGEVEIEGQTSDLFKQIPIKAVNSENNVVAKVQPKVEYVNVEVAVNKTKSVKLKERVIGSVQEGYKLVGVNLNPEYIIVSGNEKTIDTIDSLSTEMIDVSQITDRTVRVLEIALPEGIETPYLTTPVTAIIDVEKVVSKTLRYKLEDINIQNLDASLDVQLMSEQPYFEIHITGVESEINELSKSDLSLSLDLGNHIKGKYYKKVEIDVDSKYLEIEQPFKEIHIEIFENSVVEEDTKENISEPGNETASEDAPTEGNS